MPGLVHDGPLRRARDHFMFPACEHRIDPKRPQKSWRTAWRKLVKEAGRQGGKEAARKVLEMGEGSARRERLGAGRQRSPASGRRRGSGSIGISNGSMVWVTLRPTCRARLEHSSRCRTASDRGAQSDVGVRPVIGGLARQMLCSFAFRSCEKAPSNEQTGVPKSTVCSI